MSRRGRPPTVRTEENDTFSVKVAGQDYKFRKGGDGRLRSLGTPERTEEFDYARTRVADYLSKESQVVSESE